MKKALFILGFAVVAGAANAQFIYTGGTMTENFDGISNTNVTGMFSATVGVQSNVTGSTFEGTRLGGSGTSAMNLIADDGSNNSGAIHSLGATASTERALGLLASGTNIPGFGVRIENNSGSALSSITISFTQENWRSSTSVVNTMAASWGITGGGATNADYITATAGMSAVTDLDLVGPAPVTTNGALDGNLAANQVARTHTFTFSTPLAQGQSLFLRWQDVNDGGSDADLAIDNFQVTATAVPEPATMAVLGLGVAALLRRRRK